MVSGFPTPLLDAAKQKRRVDRENRRLETLEKLSRTLESAGKRFSFDEVFIFGSLSRPFMFSADSDIDLAVTGLNDMQFFPMSSFVSSSMGIETDLVQLENHRLADRIRAGGIRWTRNP